MLTITFTSASSAPRWNTLQELVREVLDVDDGRFTRIRREDGGVNYRAPGRYLATFTPAHGDDVTVRVLVNH